MSTPTTTGDTVSIQIKWGKEVIPFDVPTSILSSDSVSVIQYLQEVIQETTKVPKERQKLMCSKPKNLWKGILKANDTTIDWSVLLSSSSSSSSTTTTTSAIQFLLMGTADEALLSLAQPPTTKTIFLEDMNENEMAAIADPAGLVNLGNTCYLNSVLQCLRVIPQFQSAITNSTTNASTTTTTTTNNNNNNATTANTPNSNFFINTLRTTYQQLSKQTTPVQPIMFVQATKMIFPQFAQLSPSNGHPMQQDAEEFYSSLLSYLATNTTTTSATTTNSTNSTNNNSTNSNSNLIDSIFGIRMKETITCDEFTDPFATDTAMSHDDTTGIVGEPPVIRYDTARKLVCNIQGGGIIPSNTTTATTTTTTSTTVAATPAATVAPTNITFINDGIQLGLTTKIIKHSELLQRDAVWTSQQRMMKLPQVLTIQFGRFYWKLTPDSADHTGVKCKIMKPVAFHNTLDVYEFCTKDLQAVIAKSRQRQLALDEEILNAKLLGKEVTKDQTDGDATTTNNNDNDNDTMDTTTTNKKAKTASTDDTDTAMQQDGNDDVDDDDDDEELRAALALSMQEEANSMATTETNEIFGPGIPNDFLGYYELFAVVTHKGRDADGGHYMAWVKADHGQQSINATTTSTSGVLPKSDTTDNVVNEDWYVFDDDEVSPCKTEDVLKLKGGGDWHMSYLNFYRVMKK